MTAQYLEEGRVHILQDKQIPDYVTILRIHGPFLFGTTDKLQSVIDRDRRSDADRRLPPAQHDGDRRHRAARARGSDAAAARVGPDGGLLWRAGTAAGGDGAGRVQSRWRAPRISVRTSRPRWSGPERSTIGCRGPVRASASSLLRRSPHDRVLPVISSAHEQVSDPSTRCRPATASSRAGMSPTCRRRRRSARATSSRSSGQARSWPRRRLAAASGSSVRPRRSSIRRRSS